MFFADYAFNIWPDVYEPAEDTFLFAENLPILSDSRIVDVGTGCGILGIIVAAKAAEVLAVDINPHAVACAKENAHFNGVEERMSFLRGDLFSALDATEKFDLILFNAPYLPSEHEEGHTWIEHAWTGGIGGRQVIDRFILEAPKHLKDQGRILLLQSSLSDIDETVEQFKARNLQTRVIAERNLPFFESVALVEARC
jgi:release factor glutamine methyltransferase